jgi:integrase
MKNAGIKKRGETWYFILDQPRGADGRRRQLRKGGFKTKAEAATARAQLMTDFDHGTYVRETRESVATYMQRWLEVRRPNLKATTHESYRQLIASHITPKIGGLRLADLNAETLNRFYSQLLTDGRLNGGGGALSTRTVRYIHTVVRAALKDAVRWKAVSQNVADYSDPPPSRSAREMQVWDAATLRAFLAYVRDDRHYALWLLAATTGMRRGELAGLRWRDVDLDRAYLAVTQSVVLVGAEVKISTPKTTKSRRAIALDEATVEALRAHRQRQIETRLSVEAEEFDFASDIVFPGMDGGPIRPEIIGDAFRRLTKEAGLPVIRLHDLRHTYASIALALGVNPKVVSERLGHSDVRITLSVYSHLLPGIQERDAQLVASTILGS